MNIYVGLLFNQGHLQDPALVRALAAEPSPDGPGGGDASPRAGATCEDAPASTVRHGGWVALCCATALSAFR
ncbi:MAG: hypothetical protein KA124_12670 [Luteimonas sp.]|nr:hypothetical protein [Luteimonas sp.]